MLLLALDAATRTPAEAAPVEHPEVDAAAGYDEEHPPPADAPWQVRYAWLMRGAE